MEAVLATDPKTPCEWFISGKSPPAPAALVIIIVALSVLVMIVFSLLFPDRRRELAEGNHSQGGAE